MTDFERIYEENRAFVFKYLMKLCGDASLAEELTQEAFFRAYMNFGQLRDRNRASAWLCQIAKNTYFAWYNECRKKASLEEEALADPNDMAAFFEEEALSAEAFAGLHELKEPYKEVFMLAVFADLSFKDISTLFSKSESWARVTFYRARKTLMERLR